MGILERIMSLFSGFNFLIIPAALLAIIFHEVSHGYIAFLLGDRTAKEKGRLSLNPVRHLDIVGLLSMIFFGFGWAKPVPVNPYYFKNKKLGIVFVSIAGPLSNVIMAFVSLLLFRLLASVFSPQTTVWIYTQIIVCEFLLCFAVLNIGLAIFNIIPVPPLDGSKILFSLLPARAFGFILKFERYGMLILLVLINLTFFNNLLTGAREWLYITLNQLVSCIIL